jgi:hypothetical protein
MISRKKQLEERKEMEGGYTVWKGHAFFVLKMPSRVPQSIAHKSAQPAQKDSARSRYMHQSGEQDGGFEHVCNFQVSDMT